MTRFLHLTLPSDRMLVAAALAPMLAVVTYGAIVTLDDSSVRAQMQQQATEQAQAVADEDFVLTYVDGQKALFETQKGVSLVMVGSSLEPIGHIASIEMEQGHWTVRTTKGVKFVKD